MHRGHIAGLAGLALLPAAASADLRAEFSGVVSEILMSQTTGAMSLMSDEKKLRVVACVNTVLADLPKGKKRYILEGAELAEQERRFGKVVFENRAEWLQRIARSCASVAI